jgi:hypothetical protein
MSPDIDTMKQRNRAEGMAGTGPIGGNRGTKRELHPMAAKKYRCRENGALLASMFGKWF